MVKKLHELAIESFFTCKKTRLDCSGSLYCLFSHIYILMNRREIYFLCQNTAEYVCSMYPNLKYCKHCERLEKYNKLFEKIQAQKKAKTFRLIYLIDQITDHILKHKKYYVLPDLKDKSCDINH